jgi:hypothetical protein
LQDPGDVAYDSVTGDLYIGDSNNNVVEEVTPSGQLSIVAGTGTAGVPTSGPATSSDLKSPHSLAVDPANGDLFIEDGNRVIEEVTPAGQLSIVAGEVGVSAAPTPGPATSSALYFPQGLAVDPATGDLYIGDGEANEVLKVTPAGQLSIVAGTGVAGTPTPGPATSSEISFPWGVAFDSTTGDLFISAFGTGGDNIDEVTPAGQLSVIAGEPGLNGEPTPGPALSSELNAPEDLAVDPATGNLFIADEGNSVVEELTPAGQLSIVAGVLGPVSTNEGPPTAGPATSSELHTPGGVAFEPGANGGFSLYIADTFNNDVEEVTFPPTEGGGGGAGSPLAAALPTSLSFAASVGQSAPAQTVTIADDGTASLVLGSITLASPDASDFSITDDKCSGATLASGVACTLQVAFTPTVAGSLSSALEVPSNDPKSPLKIQLSGAASPASGSTPPPGSTKASKVSAKVTVGDQEITITTPSLKSCVASTKRLAVSLKSTKRSKGVKLRFSSAKLYIASKVAATERHVPVSVNLKLPKLNAGTHQLKVVMAYKKTVMKNGHKKTVTVTEILRVDYTVC